ncbi:MAG: HEAT repeat domain-containing protein, partial [Myxococcales bacterium]|nr:HEAT repeat domain-containing protein [Myxococcales bacterium]
MAKNLGTAVIGLLDHERVDLRAAATTVLAAVGKGDAAVVKALTARLADADGVVRRIALEGLAEMGASGIAAHLVPLLRGDDATLAERAAQLLAGQGAAAESALRKELSAGTVQARRAIASLLLRRGTQAAVDAVIDQLADVELGEQALQLLRAEVDHHNEKVVAIIEKSALARAADVGKTVKKEWARALRDADKQAAAEAKAAKAKAAKAKGKAGQGDGKAAPPSGNGHAAGPDPMRDPAVAAGVHELGLLLRLIGYMARPSALSLLMGKIGDDWPRAVRLAAIAALRRIVASHEGKSTDAAIERLIALADGADLAIA